MTSFDLIVIGAGPGGYETAARAAASGLSVALVEKDLLGGTCLNRGCIPTKALCRSAEVASLIAEASDFGVNVEGVTLDYAAAVARKDKVVQELREGVATVLQQVTVISGEASLIDARTVKVGDELYTAQRIIIATGSRPAALPIPGAELAINSDQLLSATQLPKTMVVIGGGVIGMEFASILNAFGVVVTVIEYCKEILPPFDAEIAKRLRMSLKRRGIEIITSAAVTSIERRGESLAVKYETKGRAKEAEAEQVLMAVGRVPVLPAGASELGIEIARGRIQVDDRMMTSVEGVYAIGDVNGRCMLAHAATAQGRVVLGENVDLGVVPSAVFTTPECAMVGATEEQCQERGLNYKVGKATFRANGKAMAMNEPDGLVKIIVDADTNLLLGCHICGAHAADLVQEATLAIAGRLTIDAIRDTIHGHPTLSEVLLAAAEAVK